ncbi:bacillithiol biosynthesis deacetylase BshB2 [Bacillus cereus group sp. Sample62]|uniref:bacillithiol biosynthesis deacetylase BshB2 n=1 Tax=Bacillus cereus group TaxID=86661 RepID=UPI000B42FC72|nr:MULTISPECIES: bacillithiol biosynthesis deacetylase BshB2 [Bacillus cereus group]HDR4723274.1 bacillithiol biosynthesis deacetylase BshB2 [Bacillus cereus]HDX9548549.1 bacillithiol biosynthesis deacetylase BshB2 [Bacillus thuringiensis]
MKNERHVLIVFPHPDDESYCVAGTILAYAQRNVPLTYVCLTLGEMGRTMGNPPFATRESLYTIREKELKRATNILGIKDVRMMGYRDKTLEFETPGKLRRVIQKCVEELNPSLVISFYPGYAVHPDHDATGEALAEALANIPEYKRPTFYAVAFSKNHEAEIGPPHFKNEVKEYVPTKLDALQAHASQFATKVTELKREYEEGVPETVEWLEREPFWIYPFKDKNK